MMKSPSARIPDFVIAGAPKCGSSSLFYWLAAHPAICASRKKETHFLRDKVTDQNRDLNIHEHGIEAYPHAFPDCEDHRSRVEATPTYLYEETPLRILSEEGLDTKVIFILREPADRVHSRYRFSRYRRKQIDVSFSELLESDAASFGWPIHPVEQSRYSKYLKKWIDVLGRERILVYLFEEMKKDQMSFMQKVAQDLGIDPSFYEGRPMGTRNPSKRMRSKWLHRLGEGVQPFIPKKVQEKLIPLYMKLNAGDLPEITKEELLQKEALRKEMLEEYEALENLFPELDLTAWRERSYQPD